MLPVRVITVPMAAALGERANVSGVSPKAAETTFVTLSGKTSTKYPPGATSGAVNVVERPPLVSVVVV